MDYNKIQDFLGKRIQLIEEETNDSIDKLIIVDEKLEKIENYLKITENTTNSWDISCRKRDKDLIPELNEERKILLSIIYTGIKIIIDKKSDLLSIKNFSQPNVTY